MRATGPIPPEILSTRVGGVNLAPGSLRDQLAPGATLLVFLRHFGCIFCRETVEDLRAVSEADPRFPKTVFFFQGSPTEGRALLRRQWPSVHAIADPERRFYAAFGLDRGSLLETLGPAVWRGERRARAKGHRNGKRTGDIWMMPGVFLARDERIVWSHEYAHVADHPDFAGIPSQAGATA